MKFFTLLALSLLSLPAFSQQTCYVDMVNRYGNVVATFTAYDDPSVCFEAMKDCRRTIRLSPQLGGVDCVKEQVRRPVPQPIPTPVPGPRPGPQPIPRPIPQPVPGPVPAPRPVPQPIPRPVPYRSVEVTSLIIDLSNAESSSEQKTNMLNRLLLDLNSPSLTPFVRICNTTSSYYEHAQCLVSGVQRAPREMISEEDAIYLVGQACLETSSYYSEKQCFTSALRNERLPSISYYAKSCEQMYSTESSARCYRQVFGVQ